MELGELGAADFVHAVDAMADMALDDGPAAAGGGGAPAGAAAAAAPAKTDLSNPDFLSKTKCVAAVSAVLGAAPRRYRAGRALPAATERARPPPPRACVAAAACSCCCSAAATGGARAFLAAPTRRSVLTSAPRGGPPFLRSPPSACRREAAAIANQVLQGVLSQIAAGKDVADLCDFGDALIAQLCGQVHKTKKLEKGIAFPTCVSVNECVGHFSPLKSESRVLADGDVVKV